MLVGKFDEAESARNEMTRLFPDDALLRLGSDVSCPGIFNSAGEMDAWRAEMEEALGGYSADSLRFDLDDLTYVRPSPYYTLFHGRNEKPWKCKFAKLYSDKFRREYSEFMKPVHSPGENSARRGSIRVGFVNTSKEGPFLLWLKGLMVNLSREKFSVSVLCYEKSRQKIIDGIDKFDGGANLEGVGNDSGVDFFYLDSLSMEDTIKRIRAEKFDALLYNEIGTRTANFILPFFRLAPVQCGYWCGATSGSPEMDYFISSDLVEPENGHDYVIEKLVRLKSPLIHFTPSRMPAALNSRSFYGLPETAHIYSCFQNLHKLHPDTDEVFGNILRRDPDGMILLLEGSAPDWSEALMNRLRSAIPDVAGRVGMIPRMLKRDYLNVLALSDVILDSIHHNGGTTSYESLTAGASIVTWPSRIGFGRYMSALYGKMNVMDCVASSLEEYVDIAVQLGTDPSFRESVKSKILA